MFGHDGREDEQPPHTEDDAGHGGEELHGVPHRFGDGWGSYLGEEEGLEHARGDGDKHGDGGRYQRAVYAAERAVTPRDGVPLRAPEEADAEFRQRKGGMPAQADEERRHEEQHEGGRGRGRRRKEAAR